MNCNRPDRLSTDNDYFLLSTDHRQLVNSIAGAEPQFHTSIHQSKVPKGNGIEISSFDIVFEKVSFLGGFNLK
jgi:hypothetical protein